MTTPDEQDFIRGLQRKPEWVSPQEFSEYVASRNAEMMVLAKRVCEEADKVQHARTSAIDECIEPGKKFRRALVLAIENETDAERLAILHGKLEVADWFVSRLTALKGEG